ncbi:MAG: asparagine synthase [Ignavibacteria bacterium]|nr:asparagine synthase [Ignavibacteria bacterium]
MTRIVGINKPERFDLIKDMLIKFPYKNWKNQKVFSTEHSTFGIVSNTLTDEEFDKFEKEKFVEQNIFDDHFARAREINGSLVLERDYPGVAPLYFGYTNDGSLVFASEIKALIGITHKINELKPGSIFQDNKINSTDVVNTDNVFLELDEISIGKKLKDLIEQTISKRIYKGKIGSWLSGGLDSSIIAKIVSKFYPDLYTFSGGLKGSSDLQYASLMAEHLKTKHFEIIVSIDEILKELPEVIYALESFDVYLVRSSVINYMITKKAFEYIDYVFSGEGGDELFAGYSYLKTFNLSDLPAELNALINVLHNTALQRVDRCSMSFGVQAIVPFAVSEIIKFAVKIPPELKIKNGIEKWILRKAFEDVLPDKIIKRKKEKFWEGSNVKNLISEYADFKISDEEFRSQRKTKSNSVLRSKEEYFYYKIFTECFGEIENFD